MSGPEASVAVATRGRPVRLRWLLNALAEQTAAAERFEVVVAHERDDEETVSVLSNHQLAGAGRLRTTTFKGARMTPGAGRNAALQAARGDVVLFTDDDCRPAPDWVQRALAAADAHPGAIVQGRTLPDPDELATLNGAPWVRTQRVIPPSPWAQTCNIVYPRALIERLGGFHEPVRTGEDADLAARARRIGTPIVPALELIVFHAVEEYRLLDAVRETVRWGDLAALIKRHPELRRHLLWGVWWKGEHAALSAALCGVVLARRRHLAAAMVLPWAAMWMRFRGRSARGIARAMTELPGHAVIDAAEIAALTAGSIRERTLIV